MKIHIFRIKTKLIAHDPAAVLHAEILHFMTAFLQLLADLKI